MADESTQLKFLATAEDAGASELFTSIGDKIGNLSNVAAAVAMGGGVVALGGALAGVGATALSMASQANQATNDIQAGLGLTREQAEQLSDVALGIFGNNWGDSVDDAAQALMTVRQQMKGLADTELQGATESALALRDVFGVDIPESTNAANVLMQKFGLSSEEAFDFITSGFQRGLNTSGDFLESVTEYGVQFGDSGADASQFFSILETGLQGGVLGTDKIADAFKESRIRIMEMSDAVLGGFQTIGASAFKSATGISDSFGKPGETLDWLKGKANELGIEIDTNLAGMVQSGTLKAGEAFSSLLAGAIEDGSLSIADAQQTIIEGLRGVNNQVWQNTAGVAIFGTQWEDLGPSALLSVDMTKTGLEDLAGATDSLSAKYTNWGSLWEGVKRAALVALVPIGEKLLSVANEAMPIVTSALSWLQTGLPPIIDSAVGAIGGLVAGGQQVAGFISSNFIPILAAAGAALLYFAPVIYGTVIPPFIAWAGVAISSATATITALAPVLIPIAAIAAAVALLKIGWDNDWLGIRTTLTTFWTTTGQPIFDQLRTWLASTLTAALTTLAGFWTGTLWPALQNVYSFISVNVIPLLMDLGGRVFTTLGSALTTLAGFWSETLWPALQNVYSFVDTNIVPLFAALADLHMAVLGLAVRSLAGYWDETLYPAIQSCWAFLQDNVIPIISVLVDQHIANFKSGLSSLADVWNNTLSPALSAFAGFLGSNIRPALEGIQSTVSKIVDFLKSMADAIRNMPSLPGIGGDVAGARALGGAVDFGKTYLVGEEGPELFTAGSSGYIHNTRDTAQIFGESSGNNGGGNTQRPIVINQTFNLSGDISDAQARRMMQIAREEMQKVAGNASINQKMGRLY